MCAKKIDLVHFHCHQLLLMFGLVGYLSSVLLKDGLSILFLFVVCYNY